MNAEPHSAAICRGSNQDQVGLDEKAEGVARRIEEHPHSLLRLYRRQRGAGADGALDCRVEVADPNIKVLRSVLLTGLTGPGWRCPLLLLLEVEGRPAAAVW